MDIKIIDTFTGEVLETAEELALPLDLETSVVCLAAEANAQEPVGCGPFDVLMEETSGEVVTRATNQQQGRPTGSLISLDKTVPIDPSSVVIILSKSTSVVALYEFSDVAKMKAKRVGRMIMEKDLQTTLDLLNMNRSAKIEVIQAIENIPVVTKTGGNAQHSVVQGTPQIVTDEVQAQPVVIHEVEVHEATDSLSESENSSTDEILAAQSLFLGKRSAETSSVSTARKKIKPRRKATRTISSNIAKLKEKVVYECTDCSQAFLRKQAAVDHRNVHTGAKPYRCKRSGCQTTFATMSERREHERTVHLVEDIRVCDICGSQFSTVYLLNEHMNSHLRATAYECEGRIVYQCIDCDKILRGKRAAIDHRNVHTGVKPYKCTHSGCEATFARISGRRGHARAKHQAAVQEAHVCEICGSQFPGSRQLREHMNVHLGVTPYKCRHCPEEFTSFGQRRYHEERHKQSSGTFCCDDCGQCFKRERHLVDHRNVHTGATPHVCKHCKRTFVTKRRLLYHVVTCKMNCDKVEFQCKCCDRLFKTRQIRDDHMNIHRGEKPYQCRKENCDQRFSSMGGRGRHEVEKHQKTSG